MNTSVPSSRLGGLNSQRHSQGDALGFNSLYIGGGQSVAAGGRARHSVAAHDQFDSKVRFEQHKLALEGEVS